MIVRAMIAVLIIMVLAWMIGGLMRGRTRRRR